MQWLVDNWILVLFGGGMIAMHLFGHGHGGHGGGMAKGSGDDSPHQSAEAKKDQPGPDVHQHNKDSADV